MSENKCISAVQQKGNNFNYFQVDDQFLVASLKRNHNTSCYHKNASDWHPKSMLYMLLWGGILWIFIITYFISLPIYFFSVIYGHVDQLFVIQRRGLVSSVASDLCFSCRCFVRSFLCFHIQICWRDHFFLQIYFSEKEADKLHPILSSIIDFLTRRPLRIFFCHYSQKITILKIYNWRKKKSWSSCFLSFVIPLTGLSMDLPSCPPMVRVWRRFI